MRLTGAKILPMILQQRAECTSARGDSFRNGAPRAGQGVGKMAWEPLRDVFSAEGFGHIRLLKGASDDADDGKDAIDRYNDTVRFFGECAG